MLHSKGCATDNPLFLFYSYPLNCSSRLLWESDNERTTHAFLKASQYTCRAIWPLWKSFFATFGSKWAMVPVFKTSKTRKRLLLYAHVMKHVALALCLLSSASFGFLPGSILPLSKEASFSHPCQGFRSPRIFMGSILANRKSSFSKGQLPSAQSSPTTPQSGFSLHSVSGRNCIQDSQDSNGTGNLLAIHQLNDSIPFVPPERSPAIQNVSAPKAAQPEYVARSNR